MSERFIECYDAGIRQTAVIVTQEKQQDKEESAIRHTGETAE